jgi:hypothetical protein
VSFKGTLAELALTDLIEVTSFGGKTGVLDIAHPDGRPAGRITFREGQLASAMYGALEGDRAFYALLGLKEGSFSFDPEADPGDVVIDAPTGHLLMEAMRRVDEIGRLRYNLPAPAKVALLGGKPEDRIEASVLGYLGPGARSVGDIVDGALVDGLADEYDVLRAIERLRTRDIVRLVEDQL